MRWLRQAWMVSWNYFDWWRMDCMDCMDCCLSDSSLPLSLQLSCTCGLPTNRGWRQMYSRICNGTNDRAEMTFFVSFPARTCTHWTLKSIFDFKSFKSWVLLVRRICVKGQTVTPVYTWKWRLTYHAYDLTVDVLMQMRILLHYFHVHRLCLCCRLLCSVCWRITWCIWFYLGRNVINFILSYVTQMPNCKRK